MISIIIPLYNKEASIATALRGVLTQSYQDFEVVVVDDGSTDGGAAVVEQFTDSRIRLIRQENGGVSAARNRGIAEAKGEHVAFLDADDEWLPEFLEEIAALIAEFPECKARATNYIFNSNGVKSPTIPTWYYDLMNHPEAKAAGWDLADVIISRGEFSPPY